MLRDELQTANDRAENAERDAKANARLAAHLIAAIRQHYGRYTLPSVTIEQVDEFLKPYAERIKL